MAAFTVAAEASVVNVVPVMAGPAVTWQRSVTGGLAMAIAASQALVSTGKLELCLLAMIELPKVPAVRVVTFATSLAQSPLVRVLRTVASNTFDRRFPIGPGGVAFPARHADMQADERETREIVIEADFVTPAALPVTGLALLAHRADVDIIGGVAAVAILGQLLLLDHARVAGVTVEFLMRSAQGKLGMLLVIVVLNAPFLLAVAVRAGDVKAP